MNHEEIIAQAKLHLSGTVGRGETPPNPAEFAGVNVRETALVHFQKENQTGGAWVLLDQTTGAFIAGWSDGGTRSSGTLR